MQVCIVYLMLARGPLEHAPALEVAACSSASVHTSSLGSPACPRRQVQGGVD
jgi:hypothetical protein